MTILGVILLVAWGATAPPRPVVTFPAYVQHVHALRVTLDRLASGSSTGLSGDFRRNLQSWARVRLPDGTVVSTNLGALIPASRGPAALRVAAGRLNALDTALTRTRYQPANRSELAELDAVLRDPRFHPQTSITDQISAWIQYLIWRFIQFVLNLGSSAAGLGGATQVIVAAVFLAVVAGLAVLIARGALGRAAPDVIELPGGARPATAAEAQTRADEQVTAGNYREAFRFLFLATLIRLQEADVLRLQPGSTNVEFLRLLADTGTGAAERRSALTSLIEEFDRAWYGHLPLDKSDYERCRELASRVVRSLSGEHAA